MTRKHASVDIFGAVVVKYRGQGDSRAIFLLGTEYGRLLPVVRHALWRSSGFPGEALVRKNHNFFQQMKLADYITNIIQRT